MSFSSINSRVYWEYCNKFINRNEIFSKLNPTQLKILRDYHKWISAVKYKEVMATSKLGDGILFCGLINNLTSNDIPCESGIAPVGCVLQDSTGKVRTIALDKLADIGASEVEIRVINNISNEVLSELEYLCYIKDINATDEFEAKRYDKIREVLEELYDSSRGNEQSAVAYCYYLITAKLPLTLSLISYYKNDLYELYKQQLVDNIAVDIMKDYNCSKEFMDSVRKSNVYFMTLINSYLKQDIDLDKKRVMLKLGVKFKEIYDKLSNGGKTDFTRLVEASKQTAYYVTTALGERLATKNEIKSIVSGVYKKDTYFLPKEKREKLLLFGWCVTGDEKYYNQSNVERYKKEFDRLEKLYEEIWDALTWLGSDEFLKEDLKELVKGLKPIEYPDKADDEIKEGSLVAMLKYIKEHGTEDTNYDRIALDIAEKCIKYKSYAISEKQSFIVKTVYDKLTKPEEPKDKPPTERLSNGKPNLYNEDLYNKLVEIAKHPLFIKKSFVAKIMDSVLRYKKCSEKQYDIIMDEYKRLGLSKEDAFSVFGIAVHEIDTSEDTIKKKPVENKFFIDDDEEFETAGTDIFNGNDGLGSLIDISDSLGFGGVSHE